LAGTPTTQLVRLAIIGTGIAAGELHWPALAQMCDRFVVAAFSNRSRGPAEQFAALAGLSMDGYRSDYHELLRRDDIDAVLVGVPIMNLLPVAIDCLNAGKHVICEKPTGGTLEQGRTFLDLPARYPNQKLLVAENFFYRDEIRLARSLIDAGAIGQPVVIYRRALGSMVGGPVKRPLSSWRAAPEHRGSHMLDWGVHHISEVRMYGGDVARVSADAREVNPNVGGLTNVNVNFRCVGGAGGTISTGSMPSALPEFVDECQVFGTAGSLWVQRSRVRMFLNDGTKKDYTFSKADLGYYNEFLNFHEAIVHDEPIVGTVAQSFKNMMVMMRAFDSSDDGQWCEIPPEPDALSAQAIPLWKPRGASDLFDGLPVRVTLAS
jgi:predicted dehydrogenase